MDRETILRQELKELRRGFERRILDLTEEYNRDVEDLVNGDYEDDDDN